MELQEFVDDGPATTTCPMCGAAVPLRATECNRCGEHLHGAASLAEACFRDGKLLVMHRTATLPYRCLKTNGEATRWLKRNLYWHPWAYYLLIFFPGLLIYVLVALFVRQHAKIKIPLSPAASSTRWKGILVGWLGALASVAALVGSVAISDRGNDIALLGVPFSIAMLVVFAVIGTTYGAVVSPAKIDKKFIWLRGVNTDYLAQFPEFDTYRDHL